MNQPIASADAFYGALKSGDVRTSLTRFSEDFKSREDQWPRLLDNLQQRHGPVTSAVLDGARLAAKGEDPCYVLDYSVKRGPLASTERLFVCSKGGRSDWLIHGHALMRLDTNQSITGGTLPTEVGIGAAVQTP